MPAKTNITKLSHTDFYQLCEAIKTHADDLLDMRYSERAEWASKLLEFKVTESKAKEASELVECRHEQGRIDVVYFAMVALAHSGGFTLPNLARKGREVVRQQRLKREEADGTMDLFPESPELPDETEINMEKYGKPNVPGPSLDEGLPDPEDDLPPDLAPESEYEAPADENEVPDME